MGGNHTKPKVYKYNTVHWEYAGFAGLVDCMGNSVGFTTPKMSLLA